MKARIPSAALALVFAGCAMSVDPALLADRSKLYYAPSPGGPAAGQKVDLAADADLEACLAYGLQNNPGLRAAFERWRAAVERVPQVSSLPDPMFAYAHFIEEIQTRTGPQRNRFGLSQTMPWPGKLRLAGESASHEAEALWSKVEAKRLALVREIKRAWYDYAFLGRALIIDQENLRLLKQLEPIVQRRIQGGAGQQDLLRLQVEIGKLENELETLKKLGPTIRARLNAKLNRPTAAEIATPGLEEPALFQVSTSELEARVEKKNPELESLRQKIASSKSRKSLADLAGRPDFTFGVDYFDTGPALNPATPGSGDDPIAVRVMLNIPIWGGKYAAARSQAEHDSLAASRDLADRENTLRSDLALTAYELDDAGRQLVLYRDTLLPRSTQSFEVIRAGYRAGTSSLLDVIDAERVLLAFKRAYWRAASNWQKSLADLEAICGGQVR